MLLLIFGRIPRKPGRSLLQFYAKEKADGQEDTCLDNLTWMETERTERSKLGERQQELSNEEIAQNQEGG